MDRIAYSLPSQHFQEPFISKLSSLYNETHYIATKLTWMSTYAILIDIVNGYDIVYGWFDHLKSKGHYINGYVIMPNHVHVLISFINSDQSINTIIGNGKRFMAYEIIERLEQQAETKLLETLGANIELKRRIKDKQHNVWELSFVPKAFGRKECIGIDFIWQKLNYMHNNPCTGKWQLAANPIEYKHSSAKYYLTGEQGVYSVTNFMEMLDIDLRHGKGN